MSDILDIQDKLQDTVAMLAELEREAARHPNVPALRLNIESLEKRRKRLEEDLLCRRRGCDGHCLCTGDHGQVVQTPRRSPEKAKDCGRRMKVKKYGLSISDYERMLEMQGGVCAVCQMPEMAVSRRLSIDHDHKTGAVRGLLCRACNLMIGNAGDSIEKLNAAIIYLRKWSNRE